MKRRLLILLIIFFLYFSCQQQGFLQNIQSGSNQLDILGSSQLGSISISSQLTGLDQYQVPISWAYQIPISQTQITLGPNQLSILGFNQRDTNSIRSQLARHITFQLTGHKQCQSQLAGHIFRVQSAGHAKRQVPISWTYIQNPISLTHGALGPNQLGISHSIPVCWDY